jgi:hypothetical protein
MTDLELLLDFITRRPRTPANAPAVMSDDEATECTRVILADPDQSRRDFAFGALAVGAAVTVQFPGPRADAFMCELLRTLRARAPWGVVEAGVDVPEDHRD